MTTTIFPTAPLLLTLLTLALPPVAPAQPVWINELHYDNTGTDVGEFVEVAGTAGVDLTGWSLVLYNGSSGAAYRTVALSGTLPESPAFSGSGLGVLGFPVGGLQNGAPDGLALVDASGAPVQFLSYEGAFVATDGPALGLPSVDLNVEEDGNPAGTSLQLTGAGASYAEFAWSGPAPASPGQVNEGQTFPTPPADTDGDGVLDEADLCPGTTIPEGITALKPNRWALLDDDFTFDTEERGGGEGSGAVYATSDTGGCSCEQIVAALALGHGHGRYGCSTSVMEAWTARATGTGSAPVQTSARGVGLAGAPGKAAPDLPGAFGIEGSYPNPFNPRAVIRFGLPVSAPVKLAVYDALGRPVRVLVRGVLPPGIHESTFDAAELPGGLYLAYLDTPHGSFLHKMLLSK